jgi:hypothetical protein
MGMRIMRYLTIILLFASAATAQEAKPILLFNGKNLEGWKPKGPAKRSYWTVGKASLSTDDPLKLLVGKADEGDLMNGMERSVDLYTEAKFGDCLLEIEVMVPKNGDSGIYLMGEYQIQIADSFGKGKLSPGGMGGIYATAAPDANVAKAAGEWQKFEIDFRAPRFEGEKKVAPARFVSVTLNRQIIHENVTVPGPTAGGLTGKESATGPLLLQGGHSTIAYRNIRLTPK